MPNNPFNPADYEDPNGQPMSLSQLADFYKNRVPSTFERGTTPTTPAEVLAMYMRSMPGGAAASIPTQGRNPELGLPPHSAATPNLRPFAWDSVMPNAGQWMPMGRNDMPLSDSETKPGNISWGKIKISNRKENKDPLATYTHEVSHDTYMPGEFPKDFSLVKLINTLVDPAMPGNKYFRERIPYYLSRYNDYKSGELKRPLTEKEIATIENLGPLDKEERWQKRGMSDEVRALYHEFRVNHKPEDVKKLEEILKQTNPEIYKYLYQNQVNPFNNGVR